MDQLPKLGMSPEEAARVAGLGRTLIFAAIKDGKLVAHKCGRRTLVFADDLRSFLDALPRVVTKQAA